MTTRIKLSRERQALAYLADANYPGGEWAALSAARDIFQSEKMSLESFRIAAQDCAERLCIADGKPITDAQSKIGRCWDKGIWETAQGGSEKFLDLCDELECLHGAALSAFTKGRTAGNDLLVYRAHLLMARSAFRMDKLICSIYRISEITNLDDSSVVRAQARLAKDKWLAASWNARGMKQWKITMPTHYAASSPAPLDFEDAPSFTSDAFVRMGSNSQRVYTVLTATPMTLREIAELLGLSVAAVKTALKKLAVVSLATQGAELRARAAVWTLGQGTLEAVEDYYSAWGLRDDRIEEHQIRREEWVARGSRQKFRPEAA